MLSLQYSILKRTRHNGFLGFVEVVLLMAKAFKDASRTPAENFRFFVAPQTSRTSKATRTSTIKDETLDAKWLRTFRTAPLIAT
jgi:hypothetical protein